MCRNVQNHDDPRYGCDCHLTLTDAELDQREMDLWEADDFTDYFDGPEYCECGQPFNDADPPKSGHCPECEAE